MVGNKSKKTTAETNSCQIRRLPDGELEVMMIIWEAAEPISASAILQQLAGSRSWVLSSLITVLNRLMEKGFVQCRKSGRYNLYSPLISEESYRQNESRAFLDKLYHNSLTDLVNTLYNARSVDEQDLAELRSFLDELEGGAKNE